MQFLEKFRAPHRPPGAPVATLAVWSILTLAFVALPENSAARGVVSGLLLWGSAAFAALVLARTIRNSGGRERLFWGLLGVGLFLRLAGYLAGYLAPNGPIEDGLYLVSYPPAFGAVFLLVALTTRVVAVSALDAGAILLSVGALVYFFTVEPSGAGPREALGLLARPAFDSALLFMGLVALSVERRPSFVGTLTLGFLAFLAADAFYLAGLPGAAVRPGGWQGPILALGVVFLGIAAVRSGTADDALENHAPADHEQGKVAPWRILLFWLGPLSPAVHFGLLFLWGALYGPLPAYVYWVAAGLMLYLALRVALVSLVTKRIVRRQKEEIRTLEQSRLLHDLHGAVKQEVHGISLILDEAVESDRLGRARETQALLGRALEASRGLEYGVSRHYDEARHLQDETRLDDYLRGRLARFEEYFGVKAHEDLRASLDSLGPDERAAVTRVLVEALWNVAKHSGARNVHLESRRIGPVLLVRLRDDGRGFDASDPPPGMGLRYVRSRAVEVGAELDVISTPGNGATVQLRFEKR